MAQRALVGLLLGCVQEKVAHNFIEGLRDPKIKKHFFGTLRSINDALNQSFHLEAASAISHRSSCLQRIDVEYRKPSVSPKYASVSDSLVQVTLQSTLYPGCPQVTFFHYLGIKDYIIIILQRSANLLKLRKTQSHKSRLWKKEELEIYNNWFGVFIKVILHR